MSDPDNPLGLSTAALEEVDQLCEQFERAWQSGGRPRITDYFGTTSDGARRALFQELLLLDIDYRRTHGEQPLRTDYAASLPTDAAVIETIFDADDPVDTRGQPAEPTQDVAGKRLPASLGRYRVIRRIGEGAFGTVYLARDEELQRDVAVKVPHQHLVHRAGAIDLFRNEARALATLRHAAIVPVYDVHVEEDNPSSCFVVSHFMEGGDLAVFVDQHEMTPLESARIVQRIAAALHYAHGRGLVHRDVKLSNILRDADGEGYIADFGLALREGQTGCDDGFAGTPTNMSPEQARGEGHLVDGRTDVYGLGVVLYELLTGRRPFEEKDVQRLLAQIQCRDPKPPRQLKDSTPSELQRICLKALAKRPENRYQTAIDMANDLRRFEQRRSKGLWTRPVVVMSVCTILALLAWAGFVLLPSGKADDVGRGQAESISRVRTLAVLPFRPINEEEESVYLGLGMADTLITKLSNLQQIVVRSTEAVRRYDGQDVDPIAAGKALRVDAVLAGTIQQSLHQARTSVRLLRVADGKSLWAATFDHPSVDLFVLQDAISAHVARALALQLTANERQRLTRRHTDNRQAYEAYIKGRYHWSQRARVGHLGLAKAVVHFKEAIDLDPLYALAYTGLAESYSLMNVYSARLDENAYSRARAAAQKALEIDKGLTEARAVLALVSFYYDWDWDKAEKEFLHAIELNPNYAAAHLWYAELLCFSTRFDEAIAQLKKAAELDPLSPVISGMQATPYLWRRDYRRARQELRKAEKLYPNSVVVLYGLGLCYEQESQFDKALEVYRNQTFVSGQAYALAKLGQPAEARQLMEQLLESRPHRIQPYHIALIHIGLGEFDEAFEWLDDARKARDEHMVWLKVDPKLDPLREDPRFLTLLKDVGWIE